jgi:hypothetical protein
MNANFCVFTSKPRKEDWPQRSFWCWRSYVPWSRTIDFDFVLKRNKGGIIMADPDINWDAIAYLVNLAEVNSELIHMAMKRVNCEYPRPPVMEVLTRSFNNR